MLRDQETHAVEMRHDAISGILQAAVADLLFLSELNELEPFLESYPPGNRALLEGELAAFARSHAIYDQIRLLSPTGMELVRIDYDDGTPAATPIESLQFKGDRDYFEALSRCEVGVIYVSALDLNVEHGEVELPPRPMLRLGLALGDAGSTAAYLLLNLRGTVILDAFASADPSDHALALLADENGQWLRGPSPDDEWGSILPERSDARFAARFPDEWRRVASARSGQFVTRNGLFTFDTLFPYDEAGARRPAIAGAAEGAAGRPRWKNVSWLPTSALTRARTVGALGLAAWNALGMFAFGCASWIVARWVTRRSELHRRTVREKDLLRSTLGKYLAPEISRRLLGDPARHAHLGGESRLVAVLFADIRGFTRFAERHDPEDVVAVLNRAMARLTAPLRTHRGILDKYVGDGFLAFFEASPDPADAARRAIGAARSMQRAFSELQSGGSAGAPADLGLGIGISVGRVVVGNVGSEDAMDYTVVGDAVNVAARLQDLASASEILLSENARNLVRDEIDADLVRRTPLRGRREAMDVYRLRPTV